MSEVIQPVTASRTNELAWFPPGVHPASLETLGFRPSGGGIHQSKTMMLAELEQLMGATNDLSAVNLGRLVIEENLFAKRSLTSRKLTLDRLSSLYGLKKPSPVTHALILLMKRSNESAQLLALLAAVARDPVLRASSEPVLRSLPGEAISYRQISVVLERVYEGRWGEKMLRSGAQNCASSWTQAGHLRGRVKKIRVRARASPAAAAYAVFLAHLSGFSGEALLDSGWLRLLDCGREDLVELLRRAAASGLVRVRAVGHVFEADPAGELFACLTGSEASVGHA